MKVTKQEHACLVIESAGKNLIIDPGSFTTLLVGMSDVVAIVITHEHADHWTSEQLTQILDRNPDARIFGPAGVAVAASGFTIEIVSPGDTVQAGDIVQAVDTVHAGDTVQVGETVEVGPFTLRFFGGKHAVIHSSIPVVDNVGVLVNDELYYAGDSFTIPESVDVKTLAVPAGAPWLKIGEVIDYVTAVAPRRSFAVHEMVLSAAGKAMSNARIKSATEAQGGEFFPLEPGDELDL